MCLLGHAYTVKRGRKPPVGTRTYDAMVAIDSLVEASDWEASDKIVDDLTETNVGPIAVGYRYPVITDPEDVEEWIERLVKQDRLRVRR